MHKESISEYLNKLILRRIILIIYSIIADTEKNFHNCLEFSKMDLSKV